MEPALQPQSHSSKLAVLSSIAHELNLREPKPVIQKLLEIKQKATLKFPNLGLESYEIVKANDYMYATLHKPQKEVVIVFTGQNVSHIGLPSCLVSALRFTRDIIKEYKQYKTILTGFGAGASLAERVAYFTGRHCESFNPVPVSVNFDPLFHSLPNVKEHTIQPTAVPKISEPASNTRNKQEETKENTGPVSVENLNFDELAKIKGIYIDETTNACSFVLRPQGTADSLDIDVSDLITALCIFYDPSTKTKHISFSLDPADDKNPQGPQQSKVYWPDKTESKMILQGTELGEVFFRADYHMKQMSMGIRSSGNGQSNHTEFVYPERLKKLGLKPTHEYGGYIQGTYDWSRLWLVVKELKVSRLGGEKKGMKYFDIGDVVMGVEARQMTVNEEGKLEDMQIQDSNHNSCKFAKKFTELYEEIAKEYPVYQRLKKAAKAISLAQWMWVNRIPIDHDKIKGMVKKTSNYEKLVPALEHHFTTKDCTIRVFGGVDMGISFKQLIEPETRTLYKFEETKPSQVMTTLLQQAPQCRTAPNPFVQKGVCETCSCKLHLTELIHPHEGKYYCTNHHPLYCWGCYQFIQEQYMKLGNSAAFHSNCFTCARCDHALTGQLGMIADTAYMHKECSAHATQELLATHVKDQFSASKGSGLTVFQRKLDKMMSLNGKGDAVAYTLIPPGQQGGYKLGKTMIDVSENEKLLGILKDILEKTGMKDVGPVVEKIKGKKSLSEKEIGEVNAKLGGFAGKKVIDGIYANVLGGMSGQIEKVIDKVEDPVVKAKLKESEHAKLLLLDYEDQWRLDTRLIAFLSGVKVILDEKSMITIDKRADVAEEINRFVDKTKVDEKVKKEIERRRKNVEMIAKEEMQD